MLAPPGFRDIAPKHEARFIHEDDQGRKHMLPPLRFEDVTPKSLDGVPAEMSGLSFERRSNYKKPEVKHGGISLAVMSQKSSPPTRKKKVTFAVTSPHDDKPKTQVAPTTLNPKRQAAQTTLPSANLPPASNADQPVAIWTSPFLKGIFDTENDLLYDSRWPVSTF